MSHKAADGEWADQPDDPASEDLGYEVDDWERISATARDSEKYLFLPSDEELLREEAFLVVSQEDLVDVVTNR